MAVECRTRTLPAVPFAFPSLSFCTGIPFFFSFQVSFPSRYLLPFLSLPQLLHLGGIWVRSYFKDRQHVEFSTRRWGSLYSAVRIATSVLNPTTLDPPREKPCDSMSAGWCGDDSKGMFFLSSRVQRV